MSLVPFRKKSGDPEMVKDLEALFNRAKEDRQQYERQWLINMAFYLGRQWLQWDDTLRTLKAPRVPRWRVLAVVNYVKGTIRTEYAKLTQQRAVAKAQPMSGDPDDVNQARVMDDLLDYLWTADGSDKSSKRALLWALITGTGVMEAYWNKAHGDVLVYPDMTIDPLAQTPIPHPKAGQVVLANGEPVHMGEIEVCETSPFEFYPDPFGLDMKRKSWCFNVKLRSPEYVLERYGEEIEPHKYGGEEYFEGQIATILGERARPRDGVLVKEFWQRSTKKYPNGRYVVYAGDKILLADDNPYPRAQLPYVAFSHIPVPGRFWGESIITDLVDPQKNLNKARSQAIESRNLMAKGKWIAPAGMLKKPITSMPGEVVEYEPVSGSPNAKPEMVQGLSVPDSYWKDIDQSRSEIRDVSGVNEVSHADVPSGVKSGRAIAFLQEQDDTRLGPTAQGYEDAIAELASIKLHLARQFYDEPRTIRVVGENNSVRVQEFYKDDIPEDVDVRVQAGSSLPRSRVARQEFILALKDKGVFDDPTPAGRMVVKLLEFGEVEGLYEDLNRDTAQAQRENDRLEKGEPGPDGIFPPLVEDYQNHRVHIDEHNKWRKGEDYERLDPALRQAFTEHVEAHKAALIQATAMSAATGVNLPGTDSATPDAVPSLLEQDVPQEFATT